MGAGLQHDRAVAVVVNNRGTPDGTSHTLEGGALKDLYHTIP